ncbi:MAG: cytochrome c3 family protein, partial [Planctomycetota bacterium]
MVLLLMYLAATAGLPPQELQTAEERGTDDRRTELEGSADVITKGHQEPIRAPAPTASTKLVATSIGLQRDTVPDGFVGTSRCAECHPQQHRSYLKTHHSRSLRLPTLADAQNGTVMQHPELGHSYDIAVKDGRLFHQQFANVHLNGRADRLLLSEMPVSYVMGSGAFAKGYLLEDGPFLTQSPVTWYAGKDLYAMAPGYDGSDNTGMSRSVTKGCLFCHAGLVSQTDDNPNKSMIHEMAIGCERCHGPGAAHSQQYQSLADSGGDTSSVLDSLIANPATMNRRESESLCAFCHTSVYVSVYEPGKDEWDFRPGDPLSKHVSIYKISSPSTPRNEASADSKQSFTGHFDQMWRSECYLQTETLSCTTCHDPHNTPPPRQRAGVYRRICVQCHGDQQAYASLDPASDAPGNTAQLNDGCTLPHDKRQSHANDCTTCHMPRRQTDVPHTSTTNHLIAIYENGQMRGSPAQQPKKTTPVLDGRLDSIAPDPPSTSVALRRH